MMDWQPYLQSDEQILWQGRPAPRCYTFRNWKLALIGMAFFLVSSFWQMLSLQLVKDGYSWALILIPLPLVAASFMMGPGQILLARIAWERIYYCLTDRKLLLQKGLRGKVREIPRSEITSWQQKKYGDQLSSIRIQQQAGQKDTLLYCLEQPQNLIDILDQSTL